MDLQVIRMTLTGGLEGKTIVLNRRQFVDGVCELALPPHEIGGLVKYFQRCYQVTISGLDTPMTHVEPEQRDNHAIREDDSAVMTEEQQVDADDGVEKPTDRQAAIIAAVNCIDMEKWVEQDTNPHPKVKDVAKLMEDPTVTKEEICEVIEKWLS